MAKFAVPPVGRDQLVLFPERLDEIIPLSHPVRLLDEILGRVDWKPWEATYVLVCGQPPIHPRVIAGVILYGIIKKIRSSRCLEEALIVRSDFRWLAEGRTLDHSTISKFRTENKNLIQGLFVQITLIARSLGYLSLDVLGFDGTRVRANNRRTGSKTPEELKATKKELEAKYEELEAKVGQADKDDAELLGDDSACQLNDELKDVVKRRAKLDEALAEIARLENEGQSLPVRIPTTDPESRITPNKEGGFAPNYTPTALVDIASGLIVSSGVIASTDEDKHMIPAVKDAMSSLSLDKPPAKLLADGMMCTGENLAECKNLNIDLFSPISLGGDETNPAKREDLTKPVPESEIAKLPTTTTKNHDGTKTTQFNKNAFVYDEESDTYWCPAGKALQYENSTKETRNGRTRDRKRYLADPKDCAACLLMSLCVKAQASKRMVCHEQHESLRIEQAKKMSTEEAKKEYARRRHAVERPFATIKSQFGARNFLTRGLEKVETEWCWLTSAFNLHRLMSLIVGNVGPPSPAIATA